MKNKKVVIIGNTSNARLAKYFFTIDSEYEVAAFSVNQKYVTSESFEDLPVVALEDLNSKYPPSEFEVITGGNSNLLL